MSSSTCIASPILRQSNSEARLQALRRNGTAVLGMQAPKPSGSPLFSRPQRVDVKASGFGGLREETSKARPSRAHSESKIAPPLSTSAPVQRSPNRLQVPRSRSCLGPETFPSPQKRRSQPQSEVEQVLGAALALNSSEAKGAGKHQSRDDIEAHLEALLGNLDDKENEEHASSLDALVDLTSGKSTKRDRTNESEQKALQKNPGCAHLSSPPEKKKSCRCASIADNHGDNENNIMRKGTGFVYVASNEPHAWINDSHGDGENNIIRKGTGFIHLHDSLENPQGKRVRIDDPHGDNENKLVRMATGYVDLNTLPKMEPAPWFADASGGGVNRIRRKGTGYVNLKQASRRVRVVDDHGDNENGIQRQGTGFVKFTHDDKVGTDFTVYEDALDALTQAV